MTITQLRMRLHAEGYHEAARHIFARVRKLEPADAFEPQTLKEAVEIGKKLIEMSEENPIGSRG